MDSLIISSIGTSLLTNDASPKEREQLTRTANATKFENDAHRKLIDTRKQAALNRLKSEGVEAIRKASAELNGIYGIYGGILPKRSQDVHFLITTDTIQGKATAEIVKTF